MGSTACRRGGERDPIRGTEQDRHDPCHSGRAAGWPGWVPAPRLEATRRILADAPHVGVVVLTMVEDDDSVFAAMKAGARSYLLKGARRAEIIRAITAVGDGEAIFGAAIATRLIGYFSIPRQPRGAAAFPELSPREVEILSRMARHESNPEIARRLGLTEKTVRNNVSTILTKLRVRDRAEAIAAAHAANLGRTSTDAR
jgi:DNA-binding NarL/FixJ family response regulator